MKVFISWSGVRSRAAADRLRDWLKLVIQGPDYWVSTRSISAGTRWADAISQQLEGAHFGILCITPSNTEAPWLHYEAGALAKQVDTARVVPYRIGVPFSAFSQGPLGMFQSVDCDREGTLRLVESIYEASERADLSAEELVKAFDHWWPELQEALAELPDEPSKVPPQRDERSLLEEILTVVHHISTRTEARTPRTHSLLLGGPQKSAGEVTLLGSCRVEDVLRPSSSSSVRVPGGFVVLEAPSEPQRGRTAQLVDPETSQPDASSSEEPTG